MLRRRLVPAVYAVGLLIAIVVGANAARAGEPKALIELFTSQGCSSCPPADKLFGELAADPSLVVMSVPIDYWDYLGWKDTLANPAHSARQRAYGRVRGDRQVYTPQAVINGAAHALGSDRTAIERAVTQTDQKSGVMSLPILVTAGGTDLNVQVESAENEHANGEVWLCPLTKSVPVEIGRGENRGHTIAYHNVVRDWIKLGDWTGTKAAWHVPLAQLVASGADSAVVIVQEGSHEKPGIILGAAYRPLQ
jgi:hypothetical protein